MLGVMLLIVIDRVGGESKVDTIVAAYASSNTTVPPLFETSIIPDGSPSSSGKRITNDLPSSSIVVVKSVPLTVIDAVGVCMSMLFLLTMLSLPEANLAVPTAIVIAILLLLGSGS